ncbi:MAG: Wzz/FepE/Etk N-terminal domain-containing protein [Oscillospiraceae bacterium]|nr:Wzz/FepE/Etk N-terminal domain-containing protein [Oscillospiraceae bacterium]
MQIDLVQLLNALWRRAWAIVVAVLICGAAGFCYAYFLITPLYQASVLLYVNNSVSVSSFSFSISTSDLSAAQSLIDTYVVILKSRNVLETVIEKGELECSYGELRGMISAGSVDSTEVFEIFVTSDDPQEAQDIANTIAQVLPDKIYEIIQGSSSIIIDYAVLPSAKSSPSITRYTAYGILLGVVFSCAAIIVLEVMDDLIHDEDYLLQTYQLPLLAAVPDLLDSSGGYYYYKKEGSKKSSSKKGGSDHG